MLYRRDLDLYKRWVQRNKGWKTIREEKIASRHVDKLSPQQKNVYNQAIEGLAKGDHTGLHVHDLKGNLKGYEAADLKGIGGGRGAGRIIFKDNNGVIEVSKVDLTHYK